MTKCRQFWIDLDPSLPRLPIWHPGGVGAPVRRCPSNREAAAGVGPLDIIGAVCRHVGSGKGEILGRTQNVHTPPGMKYEKVVVTTDNDLRSSDQCKL